MTNPYVVEGTKMWLSKPLIKLEEKKENIISSKTY